MFGVALGVVGLAALLLFAGLKFLPLKPAQKWRSPSGPPAARGPDRRTIRISSKKGALDHQGASFVRMGVSPCRIGEKIGEGWERCCGACSLFSITVRCYTV